jgi:hypothetical protein
MHAYTIRESYTYNRLIAILRDCRVPLFVLFRPTVAALLVHNLLGQGRSA